MNESTEFKITLFNYPATRYIHWSEKDSRRLNIDWMALMLYNNPINCKCFWSLEITICELINEQVDLSEKKQEFIIENIELEGDQYEAIIDKIERLMKRFNYYSKSITMKPRDKLRIIMSKRLNLYFERLIKIHGKKTIKEVNHD